MKRLFDIVFASLGLLALSPIFICCALLIKLNSKGPIFFRQVRVGRHEKPFKIFKFRTIRTDAESRGPQITVGESDSRITKVGFFLRKYKIDELPQLINVILGHMSFVGPRPEVPRYVSFYTPEQKKIFKLRPGITDMASITYRNENAMLEGKTDPESFYINEIMPAKLKLNLEYLESMNLWLDIKLILKTLKVL